MPSSQRVLQSSPVPTNSNQPADPPQPLSVDSDVVVVLAALLCALICVVGLALVARCAWLRRAASAVASASASPPPASKGLKKKAIRALPMTIYASSSAAAGAASSTGAVDCPICLADFCEGDEMRALPQCGHRFHVACIDTWLAAHSSCPSCRHVLLLQQTSCHRCGAAAAAAALGAELEAAKSSGTASTFLP